jgi:hypothetical protein
VQAHPSDLIFREGCPLKRRYLLEVSGKSSTHKVSARKVSAHKVSAHKVSAPKVSVPKVSALKVSALKVGALKVGALKVGVLKVGVPKVSTPKVSTPKVSTPKVRRIQSFSPLSHNVTLRSQAVKQKVVLLSPTLGCEPIQGTLGASTPKRSVLQRRLLGKNNAPS